MHKISCNSGFAIDRLPRSTSLSHGAQAPRACPIRQSCTWLVPTCSPRWHLSGCSHHGSVTHALVPGWQGPGHRPRRPPLRRHLPGHRLGLVDPRCLEAWPPVQAPSSQMVTRQCQILTGQLCAVAFQALFQRNKFRDERGAMRDRTGTCMWCAKVKKVSSSQLSKQSKPCLANHWWFIATSEGNEQWVKCASFSAILSLNCLTCLDFWPKWHLLCQPLILK